MHMDIRSAIMTCSLHCTVGSHVFTYTVQLYCTAVHCTAVQLYRGMEEIKKC
eukprot:SAG11_NODE_366_length_10128_cov_4.162030_12_plen_52_part_00